MGLGMIYTAMPVTNAVPDRRRRTARHRDPSWPPGRHRSTAAAGLSRDRYQGGAGPPKGRATSCGPVSETSRRIQSSRSSKMAEAGPEHQPQPAALRLADDDRSVPLPVRSAHRHRPQADREAADPYLDRRRPVADLLAGVDPSVRTQPGDPRTQPGAGLLADDDDVDRPIERARARHAAHRGAAFAALGGDRREVGDRPARPERPWEVRREPAGMTKVGGEVVVRRRLRVPQRHHSPCSGQLQPPSPISATGAEQRGQPTRRDMRHTVLRRGRTRQGGAREGAGQLGIPAQHDGRLTLEAEHRQRGRVEAQQPAVLRRQAEPARCEHPQRVAVGEGEGTSAARPAPARPPDRAGWRPRHRSLPRATGASRPSIRAPTPGSRAW